MFIRRSSRRLRSTGRCQRGFTLVEVLCVCAIVAVLAGLAWPSFAGPLFKARRSDGLMTLLQVQLAQERFRAEHASYGTLADIGQAGVSTLGHYTLRVVANSGSGYDLLATAAGAQASDAACRYLRLVVDGGALSYASGHDEATRNAAPLNRRCWNQ